MDYVSTIFLAFISVSLLLFHARTDARWRTAVLLGSNVLFIAGLATSLSALAPLALFLVMGYGAIRVLQNYRSRMLLIASLGVIVGLYVYLKQYTVIAGIFPKWADSYVVLGLSYILFRLVHLMVDVHQGSLQCRLSAVELFNYCCSFLTLPSGPIARFESVPRGKELEALSVSPDTVYAAFSRIANGYIKVIFVSALMQFYHSRCLEWMADFHATWMLWPAYACACSTYFLYLYSNFSGCMDIVIGFGRLYGFSLPENFDRPMRSGNFLELWSRWHITLSEWFKFYVFNPMMKGLARRWPSPKLTPYFGVMAYFVTFFLMGIWHGSTIVFVIYGVCLGFGVSANKLYEIALGKWLGKKAVRGLRENPAYALFARGFALAYFAMALTCLWMDSGDLSFWSHELGVGGFAASLFVCALLSSAVQAGYLLVEKLVQRVREPLVSWSESFLTSQLWLAGRVLFVTCVLFGRHLKVPEIIYKAF